MWLGVLLSWNFYGHLHHAIGMKFHSTIDNDDKDRLFNYDGKQVLDLI